MNWNHIEQHFRTSWNISFILAADFLSRGLDAHSQKNKDLYFKNPKDTHLSYADDIIIFSNECKDTWKSWCHSYISTVKYPGSSLISTGPHSWWAKNVLNMLFWRIEHITGFSHKSLPITYLGAPLYKGDKKCALFQDLLGKWEASFKDGKRMRSRWRQMALIKSTLSTMPPFLIQVLHPPGLLFILWNKLWPGYFEVYMVTRKEWIGLPGTICATLLRREDLESRRLRILWWLSLISCGGDSSANFLKKKYCDGLFPEAMRFRCIIVPYGKGFVKSDIWFKTGYSRNWVEERFHFGMIIGLEMTIMLVYLTMMAMVVKN